MFLIDVAKKSTLSKLVKNTLGLHRALQNIFCATKNENFEKNIFRNNPPEGVAEVLAHIFHPRTRG